MANKISVGIIGLGLIGGSIEKRLFELADKYEIKSVSKSQDRQFELKDLIDVDVLFICCEQSLVAKYLKEIAVLQCKNENAFAKTIITDVASTKNSIKNQALKIGIKNFVPGHPMAGTEKQGFENAFAELFENAKWILDAQQGEQEVLENIITQDLKANIEYLDSETHDKAVALTSHLPLALSVVLAKLGSEFSVANKTQGPGYKGMVRLASGNVKMGQEILDINRDNVKEIWNDFKLELDALLEISGNDLENELSKVKKHLSQL